MGERQRRTAECDSHLHEVVVAARIQAVLAAKDLVTLRQWKRDEINLTANLFGGSLQRLGDHGAFVDRGRDLVCRDLLTEVGKQSGGRRARFGDP